MTFNQLREHLSGWTMVHRCQYLINASDKTLKYCIRELRKQHTDHARGMIRGIIDIMRERRGIKRRGRKV